MSLIAKPIIKLAILLSTLGHTENGTYYTKIANELYSSFTRTLSYVPHVSFRLLFALLVNPAGNIRYLRIEHIHTHTLT